MSMKTTLLEKAKKTNSNYDIALIEKAYNFAEKVHKGQYRNGGADYITHPHAVAEMMVELGADTKSIIAALLHDTVEDTKATLEDIEKGFDKEIANLVDAVTKIDKFEDKRKNKELTHKKILEMGSKDQRVFLIKLADRLHNMQSLDVFKEEKRKRIAKETLEFYVPIAQKIGMQNIAQELKKLSYKYIEI